jgi:Asp-tRNA(Asn)/Glu-tRNA(Gln) amidotransferase A subunit family amidase
VDFRTETVAGLAAHVAERSLSARELTEAAIARIEEVNGAVNAFVALDPEAAMAQADEIDDRIAAGEYVGPLAGIPIGVKDLEDAAGFVTTYGSALHADDPPAAEDSILVGRLRDAGCVVVGKTNTPEYGWKADTVNPLFGATGNPWALDRSAGGSSGGSAAAVMSGMVPLATGSDGGGSIRIPAAICGMSGLKPSLGRVPGGGPNPAGWPDLSTRGVMARDIRDVALALDAVIGPEPTDLRALPMPEVAWSRSIANVLPPRRVGWSPTLGYATADPEVLDVCEQALAALEDLGTEVVLIDSVFDHDPFDEWLRLIGAFHIRTFEPYLDGPAMDEVDPGLRELVEWARAEVSVLDVVRALDSAHLLNLRLVELFHRMPLLLTPTVAGQTPSIGEHGTIGGVPEPDWVLYTYPFNLTRSPAGTVCAGFTNDGLPLGLQVIGPQHADVVVLRLVALLQDVLAIEEVPRVERDHPDDDDDDGGESQDHRFDAEEPAGP